jgi:hypothetical protein
MCKNCDGSEFNVGCLTGRIVGNQMSFTYSAFSCDSSFQDADASVQISRCPFCGRVLHPNANQQAAEVRTAADQVIDALDHPYCTACQKNFINIDAYNGHLTGKKHKKLTQIWEKRVTLTLAQRGR